jgi:arylsulfatase
VPSIEDLHADPFRRTSDYDYWLISDQYNHWLVKNDYLIGRRGMDAAGLLDSFVEYPQPPASFSIDQIPEGRGPTIKAMPAKSLAKSD